MNDVQELIKRARELAALANKATPGPWRWVAACTRFERDVDERASNQRDVLDFSLLCDKCAHKVVVPSIPDSDLIAAAPEMAELLHKLADVLEWAYKIAQSGQSVCGCQCCDRLAVVLGMIDRNEYARRWYG